MVKRKDFVDWTGYVSGDRTLTRHLGDQRWEYICVCGEIGTASHNAMRRKPYLCRHDPVRRFWRKVNKTETCWLWTAGKAYWGYGWFGVAHRTPVLAHRYSWELANGPVPEGLELDHLCRVTACVNPAHLEPVTHAENVRRGDLGRVTRERHAKLRLQRTG
jgi:hypothetical protein